MIINTFSMLMLFVCGLGVVLSVVTAGAAVATVLKIRRSDSQRDTSRVDKLAHLAGLSAVFSAVLVTISWPLLYAMLASFVPEVPGAMCIYGVTRVWPTLTLALQIATASLVFLLGGWLVTHHVWRTSGMPIRRSAGMLVLLAVSVVMMITEGCNIYYVLHAESLNRVSCCSSHGEHESARLQTPSYYLPWEMPSQRWETILEIGFFGGVGLLASALVLSSWRGPGSPRWRRFAHTGLLVASMAVSALTVLSFAEVLGPELMHLPFHHCLYCFVGNGRVPDSPVLVGNVAAGLFSAGWMALIGIFGPDDSHPWQTFYRRLGLFSVITLTAGLVMVAVHLGIAK